MNDEGRPTDDDDSCPDDASASTLGDARTPGSEAGEGADIDASDAEGNDAEDGGPEGDAEDAGQGDVPAGGDAETQDAPTGPGELLSERRLARSVSLQQAAEALNLAPRVIAGLEDNDYSVMPGSAFVRGYLRSYARYLGLDVDEVLELHRLLVGEPTEPQIRPAVSLGPAPSGESVIHRHTGLAMTLLTLAVLAGVGGLIYLGWPEEAPQTPEARATGELQASPPSLPTPQPAAATQGAMTRPPVDDGQAEAELGVGAEAPPMAGTGAQAEPRMASPGAAGADADTSATGTSATGTSATGSSATGTSATAVEDAASDAAADGATRGPAASATEADVVDVTREIGAEGESVRILAGGDDHLHFVFSGDCWVEVRDADGVDIFADLQSSGQVLDIWGRAPFSILLGYAPAAQLVYNDRPVALRPFTRNDVANLVLGR